MLQRILTGHQYRAEGRLSAAVTLIKARHNDRAASLGSDYQLSQVGTTHHCRDRTQRNPNVELREP